jgi:hypothetical protein
MPHSRKGPERWPVGMCGFRRFFKPYLEIRPTPGLLKDAVERLPR